VEHAYQAAKTLDLEARERIRKAPTPGEAKKLGRRVELRDGWAEMRLEVMEAMLRMKFRDPDLRRKLYWTRERELVEGNRWGDTFWGKTRDETGTWQGKNHLGEILMRIREEI
jgi:hypothetical protein